MELPENSHYSQFLNQWKQQQFSVPHFTLAKGLMALVS